jgi:glycerol-3-phosphate dehydrogenase (NAD(P)+)
MTATADVAEAVDGADFVVLAVPSQSLRGNLTASPPRWHPEPCWSA